MSAAEELKRELDERAEARALARAFGVGLAEAERILADEARKAKGKERASR